MTEGHQFGKTSSAEKLFPVKNWPLFILFQMKATDVPEIQESGRRLPVDITWQTIVKLVAILAFLGASLGLFFWLIKSGKLQEFLHWLKHIGFWGNLLLIAILIPLCFPATFGKMSKISNN